MSSQEPTDRDAVSRENGGRRDEAQAESHIFAAYARRKKAVPPGRYSYFDRANLQAIQERDRRALWLLDREGCRPLEDRQILEVGSGSGQWLRELIQWGARPENVCGVELLPQRVAEAKHLCPPGIRIECGSAASLAYSDGSFDLVIQATVFTSILDDQMRRRVAAEMVRVVKPDGMILWYDFHVNNPRNPDVRGVKKRELYELFPGCRITLERITLAPPLARRLAPYSWSLCCLLGRIPFLCTHYLGAIRRP